MDKFIYESKPYFYALVSALALMNGKGSTLMTISGLFMALACVSVGMLRYDSRQQASNGTRKMSNKEHLATNGQIHFGQKRYHIE